MKSHVETFVFLFAAALAASLLPSCTTTAEKPHVYKYDGGDDVSQQPWVRPEKFEGNPMGNMPQSR